MQLDSPFHRLPVSYRTWSAEQMAEMVTERVNYRDHIDPEYQRWGRRYARFPGVSECVRLIQKGKARGAWADIISFELAQHARETLPDLVDAFKANATPVRLYVMMALEDAQLPESVPFLVEVFQAGDPDLRPYAERTLRRIDTRESRRALWEIANRRLDG